MKLYFLQMILVVVGLFDDIPDGINVGSQLRYIYMG